LFNISDVEIGELVTEVAGIKTKKCENAEILDSG
jgi:hypothetical protein